MYIVYIAQNLRSQRMAELWGDTHRKITAMEQAVIHQAINESDKDWKALLPTDKNRNVGLRIVHIEQDLSDSLEAMNFTGAMEDEFFQVIGYVSQEDVDEAVSHYKAIELDAIDEMLDALRTNIHSRIDAGQRYVGVSVSSTSLRFETTISAKELKEMKRDLTKDTPEKLVQRMPTINEIFHIMGE